jgi:hypothetical protein
MPRVTAKCVVCDEEATTGTVTCMVCNRCAHVDCAHRDDEEDIYTCEKCFEKLSNVNLRKVDPTKSGDLFAGGGSTKVEDLTIPPDGEGGPAGADSEHELEGMVSREAFEQYEAAALSTIQRLRAEMKELKALVKEGAVSKPKDPQPRSQLEKSFQRLRTMEEEDSEDDGESPSPRMFACVTSVPTLWIRWRCHLTANFSENCQNSLVMNASGHFSRLFTTTPPSRESSPKLRTWCA